MDNASGQGRSTPPKRFVVNGGRIRHSELRQRGKTHWRRSYLIDAVCEVDGCGAMDGQAALVFDHCHRHGWVRAVLCNGHNIRIAHLEAAWLEYGLDLTTTPYWNVLMGCEECRIEKEPPGLCRRGHERSGANVRITIRPDGKYQRHCRTCDLAGKEVRRREKGAAARGSVEYITKRYEAKVGKKVY